MGFLFFVAITGFILLWFLSEQSRGRSKSRQRPYDDSSHYEFHDWGNYDNYSSHSFNDFGCNDNSFDSGGCDSDF